MNTTETLTHKFVAVLNKKTPPGTIMNALGHMAAGIVAGYPNIAAMRFDTYLDQSNSKHPNISDHPFIVLAADNSNQIRSLRRNLIATQIHFVDFVSIMTVGGHTEQKERTKLTPEEQLEYYGICMFGDNEVLKPLTKKFSLWK